MTDKTTDTLVTFLLDRSHSMSSCRDATIEAFNGYVETLRDAKTPILFTFIQFDSQSIDRITFEKPIKEVSGLDHGTYQPRGGTPLIEAATKTIQALERALGAKTEKPKVVVCIQTDGEENQSAPEYTWATLKALIEAKTKEGWQFNFMGAGIDAYDQAQKMGVAAMATMSYDHTDKRATRAAFSASAKNTSMFAAGMSHDTNYSMSQRSASGDRFAHRASGAPAAVHPAPAFPSTMAVDLGGAAKNDLDLTRQ